MKLLAAVMLLAVVAPAFASPLSGHLTYKDPVAVGAWQSLTSADQAIGVSDRFFHLDYEAQPLVNVSLFAGVTKPVLSDLAAPIRFLGGDVIQVPGSTLDWALGTKWGEKWVPNLKTGVLFAHDLTRLSKTHLFGDFQGVGASWVFGN